MMTDTRTRLIVLAAGGSAALMLGALAFQHFGGLAPCKMCIWQRYPHVIAIVIGILAVRIKGATLPLLGAIAALTTANIGAYHTGVERKWWEGPASCTSANGSDLTADEFFDAIMSAPVTRCDDVAWEMLGLSMASWNMVISLGLMCLWLLAARNKA